MAKTNNAPTRTHLTADGMQGHPTAMPESFFSRLSTWIDSGTGVIWLYSEGDEGRIEKALVDWATRTGNRNTDDGFVVETWDFLSGASWLNHSDVSKDPVVAMSSIAQNFNANTLVLMRDLHTLLNNPANLVLRRQLLECCKTTSLSNDKRFAPIVIIANTPVPHNDIKEYVTVVDVSLPDHVQMRSLVDYIIDDVALAQSPPPDASQLTDDLRDKFAEALLGLTSSEACKILTYAIAGRGLRPGALEDISEEKALAIRKIDGLTYIPHRKIVSESDIGGFENFLQFLNERKYAYTKTAQALKMERPRGCALIGPPGTGKTVVAKVAAKVLGLDLVLLDIGSMFQSLVGASEQKMRSALATVTAMKNVVLMVDEIDKGLGGAHKNQSSDSGVASRMLSYFLSWLSNRNMADADDNRTFVLITMNRTDGIPPELLRSGRFDRLFSTNLPSQAERQQILEIHMRKRGLNPEYYDMASVASPDITDSFSGGELEEIVISARSQAFGRAMLAWEAAGSPGTLTEDQVAPTIEDLLGVAETIKPMATVDPESVTAITEFCKGRTVPVAAVKTETTTKKVRALNVRKSNNN